MSQSVRNVSFCSATIGPELSRQANETRSESHRALIFLLVSEYVLASVSLERRLRSPDNILKPGGDGSVFEPSLPSS